MTAATIRRAATGAVLFGLLAACDRSGTKTRTAPTTRPTTQPSTEPATRPATQPSTQPTTAPTTAMSATDLPTARRGFVTRHRVPPRPPANAAPTADPPPAVFTVVSVPAEPGGMLAYLTPPPAKPTRRPAVVWLHGGLGGIDPTYAYRPPAANDQTPAAFVAAGFTVLVPSWRGTSGNPGRPQVLLGEVDDVLAAVAFVRQLPEVDPGRVYVVGVETGGTLAVLTAEAAPPGAVRAAVSIDGLLDPAPLLFYNGVAEQLPFDVYDEAEMRVRNPAAFVAGLRTPTWAFQSAGSVGSAATTRAAAAADVSGAPLHVFAVHGSDGTAMLRPIARLVADRLRTDDLGTLTDADVRRVTDVARAFPPRLDDEPIRPTPKAARYLRRLQRSAGRDARVRLFVDLAGGVLPAPWTRPLFPDDVTFTVDDDLHLAVDRTTLTDLGPMTLDLVGTAVQHLTLTPRTDAAPAGRR